MSPLRLKLAVCGSAALMVALLGSLLALTPKSSGLEGLGWTARLAVAVFLGAALTVKGFLNAILKTRSFPRAVWSALLGWVAAYTLFSVVSFPMDLLGLPRAIYELAGILLIMTPF